MAEDAKNPVCGDKETNMNPEREFVFEETGNLGINISLPLYPPRSVYVKYVKAGSLAERKGLRVGDEITIVEPHGEDGPRPNESIEIWEDRYKRILEAIQRPRSISSPLVFQARTPVSKMSSVQTKVVSTSGVGVCSSSEHDAQSTQLKGTIDETQRHGRVPKHGRANHGELVLVLVLLVVPPGDAAGAR